jgi:hypothetical protein
MFKPSQVKEIPNSETYFVQEHIKAKLDAQNASFKKADADFVDKP